MTSLFDVSATSRQFRAPPILAQGVSRERPEQRRSEKSAPGGAFGKIGFPRFFRRAIETVIARAIQPTARNGNHVNAVGSVMSLVEPRPLSDTKPQERSVRNPPVPDISCPLRLSLSKPARHRLRTFLGPAARCSRGLRQAQAERMGRERVAIAPTRYADDLVFLHRARTPS
jgi:hypothetical protein